ncbi:MAG: methyl-accepting chemotaxis protein [Desulfamplus sp.]|nr:methyl-accepting chemotaxis protein [Desulfamplus sp.]
MIKSTLRNKLLLAFFIVGILPLSFMTAVSLIKAENALEAQAFAQMKSVRDIKKTEIINYFETIKDQVVTFSEDHMIVSAMSHFSTHYDAFLKENSLSKEDITSYRRRLAEYYKNDFTEAYKDQNDGKFPEVNSMIENMDDTTIALQYVYIKDNPHPLGSKDALDSGKDKSAYSQSHKSYHPVIRNYLKKFGYYDIFLVHPDTGTIVYSVFKELDFATSLKTGPYSNTNFADAFREANAAATPDSVIFTDFKRYFPSYEAPAGFVASPIFQGNTKIGILIFQFPIDNVNKIMNSRSGMGESGETYLIGNDRLMRSDSFIDPLHHSVSESFKNQDRGKVDTESARRALQGETSEGIIVNYRDKPALSAYTPLNFESLNWALIAEIDVSEAFAAIRNLKIVATVVAVISITIIVLFSLMFIRSIVNPVKQIVDVLTELSQGEGNLTTRLPVQTTDEIGELAGRFNDFIDNLQKMIRHITDVVSSLSGSSSEMGNIAEEMSSSSTYTSQKAGSVSAAAEEMRASMISVAAAMEQSSTNIRTVASGAEEMNATISEIARNTENARDITQSAVFKVDESTRTMNSLSVAADTIGKVVESITEISEQVNLLSLNATIEAARAGEAGRGFAVVANEIKELARQTSSASMDIKEKIENIQRSSHDSKKHIEEISQVINHVNDIVSNIATAVEEQSTATNEIAHNIAQASSGVEDVNGNVTQSSIVADEISKDISDVNQSSSKMAQKSKQLNESARDLSKLAEGLDKMVRLFKIE